MALNGSPTVDDLTIIDIMTMFAQVTDPSHAIRIREQVSFFYYADHFVNRIPAPVWERVIKSTER